MDPKNTFHRSCEHWSENSRDEMEGFYALAAHDYRLLAENVQWCKWFEIEQKKLGMRSLSLLDIACGSGKFPRALLDYGSIKKASIHDILYSLLDPSSFSIKEAAKYLKKPFVKDSSFKIRLQDLQTKNANYNIAWAVHALYAIPKNQLAQCLQSMIQAITDPINGKLGAGFIAHADGESHYLEFHKRYLKGFKFDSDERYTESADIKKCLEHQEIPFTTKKIVYANEASQKMESLVEQYLQRCIFDNSLSLNDMLENPSTGTYLAKCFQQGIWRFPQDVDLIFINSSPP